VLLEIYLKNKAFFIPYLIFILIGLPIIILYPKGEIHLFINSYHAPVADHFFNYATHLGNGLTPILVSLIFLFFAVRKAIFVAGAPTLAGLLVQILKLFVFPDVQRPTAYFGPANHLHLVEGVKLYSTHSFPSGHTATIFALCLALCLLSRNSTIKLILFTIAILVAFSRVYLSQHFLNDMYAGSIVGVISVPIMKNIMNRINREWADKSLVAIIRSTVRQV